jgi:hypothetical protein
MTQPQLTHLLAICRREISGKTVKTVYWVYENRLALELESPSEYEVHLVFGYVDWELVSVPDHECLATDRTESNDYRSMAEGLAGTRITEFDIRTDGNLAIRLTFDGKIQLRTDPCQELEDELDSPCWQLFCADGYVIDVGKPLNTWKRKHRTTPFWI